MRTFLLILLATGQAVVIITRNVDLSVGSVLGLTAYLTGRLFIQVPGIPIIARARDTAQAARLYKAGITDAVPETLEASLQLSEAVLVDIGVAMGPVIASIHEKRDQLRARIKAEAELEEAPRRLGQRQARDAQSAAGSNRSTPAV